MNRLVLIGNGFDLAHNMKTRYADFIKFYLSEALSKALSSRNYSDPLISIEHIGTYYQPFLKRSVSPETAINDLNELKLNSDYKISINSVMLEKTMKKIDSLNWVDLETVYFESLLKCRLVTSYDSIKVNTLNKEFEYLKKQLKFYLTVVEQETLGFLINSYKKIFFDLIYPNEVLIQNLYKPEIPFKVHFLSFNYTKTIEKYSTSEISGVISEVNYIHGKIDDSLDSLIFGFGDEFNSDYLSFENLQQNELFTHIKSFGYSKRDNYWKLFKFLQEDFYQVFILGHSLGLSDRTMLKEIFEHTNCVSIKIFYWNKGNGQHDHTDKMYDISRHFTDKGSMRKKVVPFTLSKPMPQL